MTNKELEVYGEERAMEMYKNDNIELFEVIKEGENILKAFEKAAEEYIDSQITTTIEVLRAYEKQELSFESNNIIKKLRQQIANASYFLNQGFSLFLSDYERSKKINVQRYTKSVSALSEEEFYESFFRNNIVNHCNYINQQINEVNNYCKLHDIKLDEYQTKAKQKAKGGK